MHDSLQRAGQHRPLFLRQLHVLQLLTQRAPLRKQGLHPLPLYLKIWGPKSKGARGAGLGCITERHSGAEANKFARTSLSAPGRCNATSTDSTCACVLSCERTRVQVCRGRLHCSCTPDRKPGGKEKEGGKTNGRGGLSRTCISKAAQARVWAVSWSMKSEHAFTTASYLLALASVVNACAVRECTLECSSDHFRAQREANKCEGTEMRDRHLRDRASGSAALCCLPELLPPSTTPSAASFACPTPPARERVSALSPGSVGSRGRRQDDAALEGRGKTRNKMMRARGGADSERCLQARAVDDDLDGGQRRLAHARLLVYQILDQVCEDLNVVLRADLVHNLQPRLRTSTAVVPRDMKTLACLPQTHRLPGPPARAPSMHARKAKRACAHAHARAYTITY